MLFRSTIYGTVLHLSEQKKHFTMPPVKVGSLSLSKCNLIIDAYITFYKDLSFHVHASKNDLITMFLGDKVYLDSNGGSMR